MAIEADDVKTPDVREAVAELERQALASGDINPPIDVETNRDGTVTKVEIPLAGNGTDDASNRALATLRDDLLPQTLGKVDGVEYAVTGGTAASADFNEAQTKSVPKVFGFVLLFAFLLLLVSFRSIVIALKAIILNLLSVAAAYGVLVAIFQWGWGEGLLDFELERRHRELAADVHVRDPVRALDGLPRVHPEPDPGGLRPWPLDRRRDLTRDQVDGRRGHQRRRRDGRRCSRSS